MYYILRESLNKRTLDRRLLNRVIRGGKDGEMQFLAILWVMI